MRPLNLSLVAAFGTALVLVSAGCSSGTSGSTPSTSPTKSAVELTPAVQGELQQALDAIRVKFKAPGIQVGVWTDAGTWVGTSGVAQVGTNRAITPADHSRIGSITKTMTGTIILQLVQDGKLSFTDVIDKYVPGMPNGSTATIKNLIEMQSGIPTYTGDTSVLNQYFEAPTTVFTPAQLVDSVKKSKPEFPPGTEFQYSNTNFVLLGMVIEKVTGVSLAENFQERIFTPLQMTNTTIPGTSSQIPTPYLSGISEQTNPEGKIKNATNWSPTFANAAGEAISTLEDLHKWGVALGTGNGILNPDTQQLRVESVNTNVPPNTPERSYGMAIVNTAGWLGHTGEIPGYNTVLNYRPDTHTTIAVMVNSDIGIGPANQQTAPGVAAFAELSKIMTPPSDATASASSS